MSDYGSRGHGSDSEGHGWGGDERSRGFGDSYDDSHGRDSGSYRDGGGRGYGDSYGDGRGSSGSYGGGGYGQSYGGDSYGDGRSASGSHGRGYGDSYGRESAGSYGDSYGRDSSGSYGDSYGRDSSGSYGDYGAGAGSASIRDASPHDERLTSGRARVPGADGTGPGRARGSARVGASPGAASAETPEAKKAKKKAKRRRKLIALSCVLVMLLGIGTVVGTLFFENVPLPEQVAKDLDRNTTITYDGGAEMGKIGTEFGNRTYVEVHEGKTKGKKDKDVPPEVKYALLSMEDRGFYEHDGVDFFGVMRAFVNNVTGGETQGASTLTQQYAGQVAEIRDEGSYLRKAKEAVMAMKMDDQYSKDQIIEHYMNLVFMGRGAYGLGAAVKAWFGEDMKVKDLNASQAAVLFAQVKQPDGPYDPVKTGSDAALKDRWQYALNGMVTEGWLSKEKRDEYVKEGLPKISETDVMSANAGMDTSTGFVSHSQVIKEAEERYGLSEDDVRRKGYTIETTINKKLQDIAVDVAAKGKGAMDGQQDNLRAALVAVHPATGEVLAYYGGSNNGTDDDKANAVHPPGSSFKEVTLAAAIKDGYGPQSMWDGSSPRDFDARPDRPVNNSGEGDGVSRPNISLKEAIRLSLNTPMYALAEKMGASTIVKLARDMGVEKMQVPVKTDKGETVPKTYQLNDKKVDKLLDDENKRRFADNEVGYGQFPVSVIDMAAVNATLANDGAHQETHFIKKITDADGNELEKPQLDVTDALSKDQAANVTDVLTGVHPTSMGGNNFASNGQTFAAKSGTWERDCGEDCDENAAISFSGYVPELAAAAWVGDKQNENGKVANPDGSPAYGAGISGEVWRMFMEEAVKVKGFDSKKAFTPAKDISTKEGEKGAVPEDDGQDEGEDDGDEGEDEPSCDPAQDPNCGGPSCDPAQDPNCGGPSCDPAQDPNCEGGGETCFPPFCDDEGGRGERGQPTDRRGLLGGYGQQQYATRENQPVIRLPLRPWDGPGHRERWPGPKLWRA